MHKSIILFIFGLLITGFAFSTGDETGVLKSSIKGVVTDQISGESLAGAEIFVEGTSIRVYSDLDGNFQIKDIQPGTYNLVISYISYTNSLVESFELNPGNSGTLEIMLISAE